ncbi:hypothetical protein [Mediterraneibacter gnavus]|uniref:hypothetical protein n=1 Tax=Mediterraneibacter gnavus TaxID=33038 RepID=UPI00366B39D3
MELREVNSIFNDCYRLYKEFCSKKLDSDDMHEFIKAVDLLNKKYNCKLAEEILLAVMNEIDRIGKERR